MTDPRHLVEFARRDRTTPGELKSAYWCERKRIHGPGEGLRIADDLRRYVRAVRPDWPRADERDADLHMHIRVSEMLRSVRAR
jgi:hypothetical protein